MSTIDDSQRPAAHQLLVLADALDDLLDKTGDAPAWSMTPTELQQLLPRLIRSKNRLSALELRVLAEADRASVGDDVGSTNTSAWLAHVTGQRVATTHAAATLAEQLDTGHAPTRDALAAGRVNVEQARVIIRAIEELPADLGGELLTEAEVHLVGLADLDGDIRLDPKALKIAGRKILEVVAPDVAEAHEAKALDDEERRAAATASFTMRPDGHGSVHGRFKIPELHGAILARHLNAIAAPRHQRAASTASSSDGSPTGGKPVARPLRWGQAFCEYLETRAATGTPKAGGVAATVVVTLGLESLLGADKAASLDTGEQISASAARRLACEAGIIPAVLGGASQALDLGRKTRFHTEPQRIAMMQRDGGCAAEGCDWPPGMCHAHHLTSWSHGGRTSVDDGLLLCPRHHALAHDSRYQMTTGPSRKVAFARRT